MANLIDRFLALKSEILADLLVSSRACGNIVYRDNGIMEAITL